MNTWQRYGLWLRLRVGRSKHVWLLRLMQQDSGIFHPSKSHVPRNEETTKLDLLLRGDGRDTFKLKVDCSIRHTSLVEHGIRHGSVTWM